MTTDYAGEWVYKGAIAPRLDGWERFPFASNDGNAIIRISCIAANPNNIKSYGYIRVVYDVGNLNYSPWRRFWFSEEPLVLSLGTPEELLINQTVIRYFEVKKTLKAGYRRRLGVVTDEPWVVQLETLTQTNIPADVLEAIGGGNPVKILNAGGSGNIVIVLTAQETQNG